MGERWRRVTSHGADLDQFEQALASLPSVRSPRVRIQAGSIQAEMEGAMGSIHEVSIQTPTLPARVWPPVVRVMRRSSSMLEGLQQGLVPRAFDRLLARVSGEAVFPEPRRITSGCTCNDPEPPCRHVLALHELFARRLDENPWELLVLRGVPLRKLIADAARPPGEGELPPLAFGAQEEPVLFPEGEDGDLDSVLSPGQVSRLVGTDVARSRKVVRAAIDAFLRLDDAAPS